MFSNDSARQADACRFCWMCRHICPVAGSTGNEAWNPRARGLMVSMIERGTKYDAEIAEAMYHCTMCEACSNDCVTGYKPTDFIREARTLAVVNDIAPKAIIREIDNILTSGNIFGKETSADLLTAIDGLPVKAETLLYVGQSGRAVAPGTAIAAISFLKKAGVDFTVLKDEPASGAYLADLMGLTGDVQAVAVKAADVIKASRAKKLIVLNPMDAVMFRDNYSKWGLLGGIEVVTFTAAAAELIESGAVKVQKTELRASLHEPVKLTRGLDEEKPLNDIIAALGIDHVQLFLHGKMSRCIGTVMMDGYDPAVSRVMVKTRLDDAHRLGCSVLLAASPDDCYLMKKYAADGFEIIDLIELLASKC